jgi:hypothetical protein
VIIRPICILDPHYSTTLELQAPRAARKSRSYPIQIPPIPFLDIMASSSGDQTNFKAGESASRRRTRRAGHKKHSADSPRCSQERCEACGIVIGKGGNGDEGGKDEAHTPPMEGCRRKWFRPDSVLRVEQALSIQCTDCNARLLLCCECESTTQKAHVKCFVCHETEETEREFRKERRCAEERAMRMEKLREDRELVEWIEREAGKMIDSRQRAAKHSAERVMQFGEAVQHASDFQSSEVQKDVAIFVASFPLQVICLIASFLSTAEAFFAFRPVFRNDGDHLLAILAATGPSGAKPQKHHWGNAVRMMFRNIAPTTSVCTCSYACRSWVLTSGSASGSASRRTNRMSFCSNRDFAHELERNFIRGVTARSPRDIVRCSTCGLTPCPDHNFRGSEHDISHDISRGLPHCPACSLARCPACDIDPVCDSPDGPTQCLTCGITRCPDCGVSQRPSRSSVYVRYSRVGASRDTSKSFCLQCREPIQKETGLCRHSHLGRCPLCEKSMTVRGCRTRECPYSARSKKEE